jgi:hypothetical protein
MIAAENIGPIASACATAWIVVRFLLPSLPPAASGEPETVLIPHASFCPLARFGGDDIRFEHRMSTIQPLRVRSVVGLAYDEIRTLIVDGPLGPGARLGQAELAVQLGISRTSVREALRRLAGDGIVEFEVNRGFFVASRPGC